MSRIGNAEIPVPNGVTITQENNVVTVRGPKGELKVTIPQNIVLTVVDHIVHVKRLTEDQYTRAIHGSTRAHVNNAIVGVVKGWDVALEMIGVGYRAQTNGSEITLTVGFSHPVKIKAPLGIQFQVTENTKITVSGANKKDVGEIAAQIRKVRKPEPYKGKGIRYMGERVRKKAGKAAKAAGAGA